MGGTFNVTSRSRLGICISAHNKSLLHSIELAAKPKLPNRIAQQPCSLLAHILLIFVPFATCPQNSPQRDLDHLAPAPNLALKENAHPFIVMLKMYNPHLFI